MRGNPLPVERQQPREDHGLGDTAGASSPGQPQAAQDRVGAEAVGQRPRLRLGLIRPADVWVPQLWCAIQRAFPGRTPRLCQSVTQAPNTTYCVYADAGGIGDRQTRAMIALSAVIRPACGAGSGNACRTSVALPPAVAAQAAPSPGRGLVRAACTAPMARYHLAARRATDVANVAGGRPRRRSAP